MYLMNQSATHFLENVHVFNHFAGLCAFFLTIAGWKVTAGYMWRRLCDVCSLYVCVMHHVLFSLVNVRKVKTTTNFRRFASKTPYPHSYQDIVP